MRTEYGVVSPHFEWIRPAKDIFEASALAGIDGQILARQRHEVETAHHSYEAVSDWYEPHCDYCQERGDLREMAGHLCCRYCWAEVFEAVQGELRWRQLHAHDKAA